jgi:NAD(P)H-dependent flavin oxidoreductase YrpB (nitropropane dioxygenase family)
MSTVWDVSASQISAPLAALGVTNPVIAAPMAGGPTVPALVTGAWSAGSLGFLAGGYKSADALATQLSEVRTTTDVVGVNLFAPNPLPVDRAEYVRYAAAVQTVAGRYDLEVANSEPLEDDDAWSDKIDLLLTTPVPVVSFTFGVPPTSVISALANAGSYTVQTVTSPTEVAAAEAAGVDALAVQSAAAGGHRGVLDPRGLSEDRPLPELVAAVCRLTRLPVYAAGGVAGPADVTAALAAGAGAVMVGTLLIRAVESGASAVHRTAVADHDRGDPVVTKAFTGRPARGLPNEFISRFEAIAPFGYPAVHHLTSALRKAAAAAGDPELVNLWAGTGYREAREEPAATILEWLATDS